MIKKLSLCLVGMLCFLSTKTYSQTQETFSGWGALFSSYKLNDKFSIHFDGQLRSNDGWKDMQTYMLRPGLNYHFKPNMVATVGYLYVGTQRTIEDVKGWVPEHRIWEQFIVNQKFDVSGRATTLQHRFRLEQRFLPKTVVEGDELSTDSYDFAQRLRYFARAIFPLKKTETFTEGAFIALQDEIFFNVQNSPNDKFFDQNRIYLAVGWRLSPAFDIEAGYMNQFVVGRNTDVSNSILQLALYARL